MKFNDVDYFKAARKALKYDDKMPAVKLFGFTWAVPEWGFHPSKRELTMILRPAIEVLDDKPAGLADRICEGLAALGAVPFVSPTVAFLVDLESDELTNILAEGIAKMDTNPMTGKTPWNGEGLPPVGTVCEITHLNAVAATWREVEILYASRAYFIVRYGVEQPEQHYHAGSVKFRPIRTAEQTAAAERSKACDEMYGVMTSISRPRNRSDMAEALYDAGYRKVDA